VNGIELSLKGKSSKKIDSQYIAKRIAPPYQEIGSSKSIESLMRYPFWSWLNCIAETCTQNEYF
jgi:hypothetical protein